MLTSTPLTSSVRRAARRPVAVALALLLAAGAVGAACSSSDEESSGDTTTTSNANDVQRFNDPTDPIPVTVGDTFQMAFPADAGACYSWDLTTTTSSSTPVSLVTSRPSAIVNTDDAPSLTGESDTDIYEFTALSAGTVDLEFKEISPCNPGDTRDTRSVTVNVAAS
jgi:predicted secreted protein